ncbi:MAG TPA: hypothetical protein VGC65_00340 [Bacteroidia bacterium]|jgi:hypothetical protein
MDTTEMLTALASSNNSTVRNIAERILNGDSTVAIERKYTGHFMSPVLDGDFEKAVRNADNTNLHAFYIYMETEGRASPEEFILVKKRAEALGIILA